MNAALFTYAGLMTTALRSVDAVGLFIGDVLVVCIHKNFYLPGKACPEVGRAEPCDNT
jgi:hypothetical protein